MVFRKCMQQNRIRIFLFIVMVYCFCGGHVISARAASGTLSLNQTKVVLNIDDNSQLKLFKVDSNGEKTRIPAKKVTWKSSKKAVASVSKTGLIQANKGGRAVITAKYKGKKYKCRVTVAFSPEKLKEKYDVKETKGSIVLAGSSSIKRWIDAEAEFAPYRSINMGLSGSKSTDWLEFYKDLIVRYQPQAIVLYVGGNDIGNSANPAKGRKTAESVCKLLKKLRTKLPGVPIYYVSICQNIHWKEAWDTVDVCNTIVRKYCKSTADLNFIDIAPCFWKKGKLDSSLFEDDGQHPNEKGYKIWSKYVVERVKKDLDKLSVIEAPIVE